MTPETLAALAAIKGLVSWEDGEALARMASTVAADQAIVEVGSHRGLSTCWLAAGSREDGHGAPVWAIDPWPLAGAEVFDPNEPWAEEGAIERWLMNIESIGATGLVTPLRSTGVEVAGTWDGPAVGMFFHDAEHSYEGCRDDYLAWLPHFAPGCWIAVHDYFGAVPDSAGGWRRVGVVQAAVAHAIVPSGTWSDVEVIGTPFGDAATTPNLWIGRWWPRVPA